MMLMTNLKKIKPLHLALAVLLIVVLVLGGMYLMKKRNEGFNNNSEEPVVVYFFYVDWCPHCTNAKPEVAALEQELATQNNLINGVPVTVQQVNCDEEKELAAEHNVKAYPTVVAVKGDNKEQLDNKVTKSNLKDWISRLISTDN